MMSREDLKFAILPELNIYASQHPEERNKTLRFKEWLYTLDDKTVDVEITIKFKQR